MKQAGLDKARWREMIGIHAGEVSRLLDKRGFPHPTETSRYRLEYPLIEHGIYQHHCIALIQSAGLPVPAKSACFFCPNAKPSEIVALKENHPELYARSIAIEQAGLTSARKIKGLGRRFAWEEIDKLTPLEALAQEAALKSCKCID